MFSSYIEDYDTTHINEQKNLFHDDKFNEEYKGYIYSIIDYIYENFKATPHKTCAEYALTDFSSDCIEISQTY